MQVFILFLWKPSAILETICEPRKLRDLRSPSMLKADHHIALYPKGQYYCIAQFYGLVEQETYRSPSIPKSMSGAIPTVTRTNTMVVSLNVFELIYVKIRRKNLLTAVGCKNLVGLSTYTMMVACTIVSVAVTTLRFRKSNFYSHFHFSLASPASY